MKFTSILLLGLVSLTGCVSRQMRSSMGDYGAIFADSSNKQLLLNLARLDNRHPPYFFQMGQVSVIYNTAANIGISGTDRNPSDATWPFTGTGNVGASAYQSPTFTFVPLSGNRFSDQLLRPLSPQVFNALFQQGFPVDILMRICVQRIEFTVPVRNASAAGTESRVNRYSMRNDATIQDSPDYESFLRTCALLRELQNRNLLHLRPHTRYEPIDEVVMMTQPGEREQLDAADKGYVWRKAAGTNQGWQVCRRIEQPILIINRDDPRAEANLSELKTNAFYNVQDTLANTLSFLSDPESSAVTVQLEMRAPLAAVALAAREQRDFEDNGALCKRIGSIAPGVRHPVLITRWDPGHLQKWCQSSPVPKPGPEVVSVYYRGTHYTVADELGEDGSEATAWNRSAFFLLHVLMAQSDVDVTKINYQGYLQVR